MFTKARIAEHPIHPMLVAFPVAMYVATAVALIVFGGTHDPFWYRAAFWTNLAGVVMAAVAAVPGLIDLISLPADSKARTTGLQHAGLNVLTLVMFVISGIMLGRSIYGHDGVGVMFGAPLVLSLIGCALTVGAGWLGWKMVQTHHVGVKPTLHTGRGETYEEIDDLDELVLPPGTYRTTERGTPMHH